MPVSTTILTGFLGAGKTTLMQSLLVQARDLQNVTLGVIVNEMSTLDVDGSVLDTSEVISRRSQHFASIPGKSISSDEGLPLLGKQPRGPPTGPPPPPLARVHSGESHTTVRLLLMTMTLLLSPILLVPLLVVGTWYHLLHPSVQPYLKPA